MSVQGVDESAAALARAHKPPHFQLERVVRPNILSLKPYRCARDDYQSGILLDANENALGHALPEERTDAALSGASPADLSLHRYPDPSLYGVRAAATTLRGLPHPAYTFMGVGSDEVLDLIQRCFARPGQDKILICPPTYGMYSVCAAVNDVEVVEVPLRVDDGSFALDVDRVNATLAADPAIKLVFLCSPGNPTSTLLPLEDVRKVLDNPAYNGLVVVDEAYIDFALAEQSLHRKHTGGEPLSACALVPEYANLIVSQTLSKSFGLAAIRLGLAFAQPATVQVMNNTKAPYNISSPAAYIAAQALSPAGIERMQENVRTLLTNRDWLLQQLQTIPAIGGVLGANDANFVLAQVLDRPGGKPDSARSRAVYRHMAEKLGLVVRDRGSELGCAGCLRITVGTDKEMARCVELLRELLK